MTVMPVVLIFQLVFSGGLMGLPARLEPVTGYIISNTGLKLIAAEADYNHLEMTSAWNTVAQMKGKEIKGSFTVGQLADLLENRDNPTIEKLREVEVMKGNSVFGRLTIGDIADDLSADNPDAEEIRKKEIQYDTTVGDLLKIAGEEKVRDYVVENTSETARKPEYNYDSETIVVYWLDLLLFAGVFALGAMITLEFIDRDRR